MNQLFGKFHKDILGLLWLSASLFIGLSLFSYQPSDPSFNTIGRGLIVNNYCGYFGSFMADIAFQSIGLASWTLFALAVRNTWNSFLGLASESGRQFKTICAVMLLITLSSLGALYWPNITFFAGQIHVGGLLGLVITKGLLKTFNFWGEVVLLWTLTFTLLVFYFEKSLKDIFLIPTKFVLRLGYHTIKRSMPPSWFHFVKKIKSSRFTSPLSFWRIKFLRKAADPLTQAHKKSFLNTLSMRVQTQSPNLNTTSFHPIREHVPPLLQEPTSGQQTIFPIHSLASHKESKNIRPRNPNQVANWKMPSLDLLEDPPTSTLKLDSKLIQERGELLLNKFKQFSVGGEIVKIITGPAVTLFEFKPHVNVRINKITELADDLLLALSSESIRVIAPIPGRDVVGIEVSNANRDMVYLKDVLVEEKFWDENIKLPLALGANTTGNHHIVDLRKIPHLMIAGSTGSGKSVFVVSLITGLLIRHSPKTLRLILIDPKQVDLTGFNDVPHLLMPPVRETKKAILVLKWCVREMDKRYRSMAKFGARGIDEFNNAVQKFSSIELQAHTETNEGLTGADIFHSYYFSPQPFIVIVIEEFGDLMAVDKGQVETLIVRLSQMARACGIHLILAMQSPRKDVVTGLIKTNIPGRISFKVASKMDSRIILDESGAERLLASGDMLFLAPGVAKPDRNHGPWISDEEIKVITDFWKEQGGHNYDDQILKALDGNDSDSSIGANSPFEEDYDDKYDEVLAYVSSQKEVSASLIQRRFRLGYPRAARIIETFEAEGVVGPANGSKPRKVLCNSVEHL